MRVDPNQPINQVQECVLCERGMVVLHDGSHSSRVELADPDGPFLLFCRSLDPNRAFISAYIPDDADRDVFFAAREAARSVGLHVQSTVETPERQRIHWESYVASKKARPADPVDRAPTASAGGTANGAGSVRSGDPGGEDRG